MSYVRINTGHESKETMVEFFYAFGHLATNTLPGAKAPGTTPIDLAALPVATVQEHLKALAGVLDKDDADIKRYRSSIVASYCAFALQNVRPKGAVRPLLVTFFTAPAGRVTIETQRYLAAELFAQVQAKPLDPEPTLLAALCRAAVVLPAWSFAPIAAKLNLGKIGTSEEAARLTTLVNRALGVS